MNAMIESAHAGNFGNGFAVVANEIRKLAENSTKSSKNIKVLIKDVLVLIEQLAKASEIEDESFETISHNLDSVNNLITTVKNSLEEQVMGSKQISESLEIMSDVNYQVKSASEEMVVGNNIVLKEISNLKDMYDYSVFTDESLDFEAKDYLLPSIKTGGAIVINNYVLTQNGLSKPTSYADLLSPDFDNLVSMPSPKSSGTGYMFYLSLVNAMGEQNAISYFDSLSENVLSFTSSGSGPINSLVQRDVAVGFGMISQAADKISSGVSELEIVVFEEGAPYNLYGNCIVKGKEQRTAVKEVMDYLYSEFTDLCSATFCPESVLKNKTYEVENYPSNITYSNMEGNTLDKKEELLEKWTH